jgi:uncharacterized protein YbjT (DUF2867 family)
MLITGATGHTGLPVVTQLRERGARVRALVRRKDSRSAQLAALGAEVVVGDLFDTPQVEAALQGVSRLYFCPPVHPHMADAALTVATAARRSGVEAIVGLSQWLASPSHPALLTRQHWLVDQLFAMVPNALSITVNPGFFAETYLGFGLAGMAAQLGVLPTVMGTARNAPPSNEDIARVVVGCLLAPERFAGRTLRPTGPKLLTHPEMAAALGEALGRKVRSVEVPLGMLRRAFRTSAITPYFQTLAWRYYEENVRGVFARGAPTNHVREASGVDAEDFLVTARRYAALPEARRTLGNFTRAMWNGVKMTVLSPIDTPRLERALQLPLPAAPERADTSERWAREHGVAVPVQASAALPVRGGPVLD